MRDSNSPLAKAAQIGQHGVLQREGDGEDVVARDSRAQQVRYAVGDDPGLSAAGPGEDHEGPLTVNYRFALGGIALFE